MDPDEQHRIPSLSEYILANFSRIVFLILPFLVGIFFCDVIWPPGTMIMAGLMILAAWQILPYDDKNLNHGVVYTLLVVDTLFHLVVMGLGVYMMEVHLKVPQALMANIVLVLSLGIEYIVNFIISNFCVFVFFITKLSIGAIFVD